MIRYDGSASSQSDAKKQQKALGEDDNAAQLAKWLAQQTRKMYVMNLFLVLTNLGLMVGGPWIVKGIKFIPSITPSWGLGSVGVAAGSFFDGAIELYLVFSCAWLLQQLIGLLYNTIRTLTFGARTLRHKAYLLTSKETFRRRATQPKTAEQRTWRVAYDELCLHLYARHILEYHAEYDKRYDEERREAHGKAAAASEGSAAAVGEHATTSAARVGKKSSSKVHPAPPISVQPVCEYEEALREQPTSTGPVTLNATSTELRSVYGARTDGKRHASSSVVDELIQAERAWGSACASSLHLARACQAHDESVLRRRWALHRDGIGGHAPTADMLLTAINEGAHLDDRAWDLINELNSLAARPFCVPTPLPVQASPGQVVTVRVEPNETVAEVRAKVEMATGVPQATAALAFTPPLLVGAAESEELEPVVLSSGDPLATDTGGVKLVDLGVDNGDLLQLGSLPPVGGVSAVVDLPTDLHGVFGEQLAVAANAHDTVETLKKKIDALVGIPLGDQCLRSAGSLDKLDDAQQLISHGAASGAASGAEHRPGQIRMQLTLRAGASPPSTPYTVSIAVPPPPNTFRTRADTVDQLKAKVQITTGLDPASQVLATQVLATDAADQADGEDVTRNKGSSLAPGSSVQLLSIPKAETVVVRLPPSLCALYGPTVNVAAAPTDTVGEVKAKLEKLLSIAPDAQTLSFGGIPLADESASLHVSGAFNTENPRTRRHTGSGTNRVLDLAVHATTHGLSFEYMGTVSVAVPPPEACVRIATSGTASVCELKAKIAKAMGHPPSGQFLMLDGELIDESDGQSLDDAGIANGDELEIEVPKPKTPPSLVRVALPPSMHAAFGPTLQVATSPSDTTSDLKTSIHEITGVPPSMQALALDGEAIGDEEILSVAGSSEKPMALTLNDAPPRPAMLVTVAAPWYRQPTSSPSELPLKAATAVPPSARAADRAATRTATSTAAEPSMELSLMGGPPPLARRRKSLIGSVASLMPSLGGNKSGRVSDPNLDRAARKARIQSLKGQLGRLGSSKPSEKLTAQAAASSGPPHALQLEPSVETYIAVSSGTSVHELKHAIQSAMGHAPINQVLGRSSEPLPGDDAWMDDEAHILPLVHGDTVPLRVIKPDTPSALVKVALPRSMHATFGPAIQVAAAPSDHIEDVKARVTDITGVPRQIMAALTLAGAPVNDDATLSSAGVPSSGGVLKLNLTERPAPPACVVKVTPTYVDAADLIEQHLSAHGLEAMALASLLKEHKSRVSPTLASQADKRLAQIQEADAAIRLAIESMLKLKTPLDADAVRGVLEEHKDQGSRSAVRRLGKLLATMDSADAALRAAIAKGPLTKATLRAALERYGDAASPSVRKEVVGRLQEFDEADSKIKAAIKAVTERERLLPAPPYEAKRHREVLVQYGPRATPSLCAVLAHRLDEMDAADAALTEEMSSTDGKHDGTVEWLRDALLTHGHTCSPSLEVAAKTKLAELDPSQKASQHVSKELDSKVKRRIRRNSVVQKVDSGAARHGTKTAAAHEFHRVHDEAVNWNARARVYDFLGGDPQHGKPEASGGKREDFAIAHYKKKDWSKVQSRFRENNNWHGRGSRKKLLAVVSQAQGQQTNR